MSALFSIPRLFAQGSATELLFRFQNVVQWLLVFGEPDRMIQPSTWYLALFSGLVTWLKVISLFCLLGWVGSWLIASLKERVVRKWSVLDLAALVALIGGVITLVLWQMQVSEKFPILFQTIAGRKIYLLTALTTLWIAILFLWVEATVWSSIRRLGKKSDVAILIGMHFALALGIATGLLLAANANAQNANQVVQLPWWIGLNWGLRLSGTYMGYVILMSVSWQLFGEVLAVRWRRIYAIAKLSVVESNRRMWAPWVVITVFLVILAFTHWFLQPPRPAEMGRLFVGTLSLLCSLLLTVMITLLTPLSLPYDIQNQTIYTVVSKPVRRIELIWGRMLGFMTIVTVLVLVFGGISLVYLKRNVGGTIDATEQAAIKAGKEGRITEYNLLRDQAEQLRNRMTARIPVYGVLTFTDSRGTPHTVGIDVGQEQSTREPRSHIEGGTPATAFWRFGRVPDPRTPANLRPPIIDARIPVDLFLRSGTVEFLHNRAYAVERQILEAEREQAQPGLAANRAQQLAATVSRAREDLKNAQAAYETQKTKADDLEAKASAAAQEKKAEEAAALRKQASELHSKPITVEMTFNIYRTTKGEKVGQAVYAQLEASNPLTGAKSPRDIFPVREYYTNKRTIPAELLAGSDGNLQLEVQCLSLNQYLGMAQHDLFLLANEGDFGTNFMKGLFGVWLQAMVLTAIGVCAGTFLSWPVALLTTIAFFVAGQVAFAFLLDFTRQSLMGGGPFESMIRLLTHDNQMSDLNPTFATITAKTLDAIVMPVMSRLVYIVPNFSAMDVTNMVSEGFDVPLSSLAGNSLLAVAYALPFSIIGFFILKNREVAA